VNAIVIGGGSAGAMAAMHLTRFCGEVELIQIRDPNTPIIGVGESTTAGVHSWLREVIPNRMEEVRARCEITAKRGVQFEGWGTARRVFTHDFVPRSYDGVHLSARELVRVLDESIRARQVTTRVQALLPSPEGGSVVRTDEGDLRADLVVDARGYPRALDPREHLQFTWIPTNAAVVGWGPPRPVFTHTRAVARPFGWIFVIPLREQTAYGYITRGEYLEDAGDDFSHWLGGEGVRLGQPPRRLSFPNFVRRRIFDGRVFAVGNAASFIEPLEATALAVIKNQLPMLQRWVELRRRSPAMAALLVDAIDDQMRTSMLEVSLFIGFHYACGSAYDSPFWRDAKARFHRDLEVSVPGDIRRRFEANLRLGRALDVDAVRAAADEAELAAVLSAHDLPPSFGGISPVGFSQVAAGLGYGSRGLESDP
jgi:tryptophan halogenase